MPPIQLTDDARRVLMTYPWPGNIRELKNITEQISIIEKKREIDAATLQTYIPLHEESRFPTLVPHVGGRQGGGFESEREILYKVLFDMRSDVTELKRLVGEIMSERKAGGQTAPSSAVPYYPGHADVQLMTVPVKPVPAIIDISAPVQAACGDVQDTTKHVEESLFAGRCRARTHQEGVGEKSRQAQERGQRLEYIRTYTLQKTQRIWFGINTSAGGHTRFLCS